MKFKCKKCKKEIQMRKIKIAFVNGQKVIPGTICCGKQMDDITESNGFGGIVSKPGGKIGSL